MSYMYAQPRSPKETPEDKALSIFGIGKDSAVKSWAAYQELASDEPQDILGKAPPELQMAAMNILARLGVDDVRAPDMIVRAMANAQSPRDFWSLLERYRGTLEMKKSRIQKTNLKERR